MDAVRRAAWWKSSLVWLLCVGGVAGGLFAADGQPDLFDESLLQLGGAFAFAVVATRTIGSRLRDLSTLVLVFWGLSFGFWATPWMTAVGMGLDIAFAQGGLDADMIPYLHLPVTIASAGLATAALLYVGTTCGRVAGQTIFATLAAAVTPLFPDYSETAITVGAVAWHAVVTGGLCSWGIRQAIEAAGVGCGKCGADLRGLASPVCPSCGSPLRIKEMPPARAATNLPPTVVHDPRLKF